MKRTRPTIIALAMSLLAVPAMAQEKADDLGYFNHLSAGLTLGTTGIGIDLTAPIGEYLELNAGYSFMPRLSYKTDVHYKRKGKERETEVEGKLHMGDFKLLLNYFPFRGSSFRLTGGFYIGKKELVSAENTESVNRFDDGTDFEEGEGLEMGDYIVGFNKDGFAKASIKVNSFKPYVGIGIGRNIPRNTIGVSADLGVQFWGSPAIYEQQTGTEQKLEEKHTSHKDGGAIKTLSKISVWPVLTIRIGGKLF